MPLQRRIPKRGFTPRSRTVYQVVNVGWLERIEGNEVTPEALVEAGLVRTAKKPVKILGNGDVARAFSVTAHAFSGSAKTKIEAAGGTASLVSQQSE